MTHLAILCQKEFNDNFRDPFQLNHKITNLSHEIQRLNHIIEQKDAALEEISQAFNKFKIQYTANKTQQEQLASLAQNSYKLNSNSNQELQRKSVNQKIDQIVSFLFSDLERVLAHALPKQRNQSDDQFVGITKCPKYNQFSLEKIESNDTSLQGQQDKKIYQVPIEMQFLKEMIEADVQVDISPSKSFIYQVPLEMIQIDEIPIELGAINDEQEIIYSERKRYQIPVQINEVFQIMGNLSAFSQDCFEVSLNKENKQITEILQERYLKTVENEKMLQQIRLLQEKIKQLQFENQQIRQQKSLIQMFQVPIELQMPPQLIEVPIQVQIYKMIEVPIEVQLQPKLMEAPIQRQIVPKIFEIPIEIYLQSKQGMSEVKGQLQLFNTSPELESYSPLNINSPTNSMIEQNKLSSGIGSDIRMTVEVDAQTDREQQLIPLRLKKTVSSIKYFELPLEVKTTVSPVEDVISLKVMPIQQKDKVQNPSKHIQTEQLNIKELKSMEIQTDQNYTEVIKLVEMPIEVEVQRQIIREVPIQMIIQKEVIKYIENESRQIDNMIIKQVPIQVVIEKMIEVPTYIQKIKLVQVPVQVEIIKYIKEIEYVEVEKQVEVIKQIEIIKEIQVIRQVQKIKLVQVPVEVELIKQVEVVKEGQVVKEIQTIKFIELPVQVEITKIVEVIKVVEVIREIEVIKEVPIYIQKIKLVEIPMEVEVISYIEASHNAQVDINDEKAQLNEMPNQIQHQETEKSSEKIKYIQVIKEVPVYIQRIKLVEIPVQVQVIKYIEVATEAKVKQIPAQVIKQIEIQIVQIPIEVVIQKIVYVPQISIKQVPVEVQIQKIVIKQVPIQIQIQKIVIKQVPIELVVQKQVILEKQIQRIVEVFIPAVQQIPVEIYVPQIFQKRIPYIQQVPIELQMLEQKFIQIKQIVEIPVLIFVEMPNEANLTREDYQKRVQDNHYSLQRQDVNQEYMLDSITNQPNCKIFQLPIELQLQKIIETQKFVQRIVEIQKIVQVEKIVEKIVYIEKIIEVEKIVQVQRLVESVKILEIPVIHEIIVEAQQQYERPIIYEVPMQLQIQKIVYIEKPIQVIKEIQVIKQKIIQLPIQCVIEVPIYIQTIKEVEKIVYLDRLIEIPTELQMVRQQNMQNYPKKQLKIQSSVFYQAIRFDNYKFEESNLELYSNNNQHLPQNQENTKTQYLYRQVPIIQLINIQIPASHHFSSIPRMYSMETVSIESHSRKNALKDYTFRQSMKFLEIQAEEIQKDGQIIIQIDCNSKDEGENDDEIHQIQLNIASSPLAISSHQYGIQTFEIENQPKEQKIERLFRNIQNQTQKMISIFEIPIEMQMVQNQSKYQQIQIRNQLNLQRIRQKYDQQLNELHYTISMLQQITKENNDQKQQQMNRIEQIAYKLSSMQNENESLKVLLSNAEQQILYNSQLNVQKEKLINQLRKQIIHSSKTNKNVFIYELPIQMVMQNQAIQAEVQTQDIDLFANVQVLQVPINMHGSDQISQVDLLNIQAEEAQQFLRPILSSRDRSHNFNIKRIESIDFKSIASSRVTPIIYQIPVELYIQNEEISSTINQPSSQEIKLLSKINNNEAQFPIKQDMNSSRREVQVQTDKQSAQNKKQVLIQTETLPPNAVQHHIFQIPLEFTLMRQNQNIQIQTEEICIVQDLDQDIGNNKQTQLNKSLSNIDKECLELQNENAGTENYSFKKYSQPASCQQTQSTQYFTSRIFQVPVQLELISDQPLKEVTSTTSQTEIYKSYSIHQQFQLQQILSTLPIIKPRKLTIVPQIESISLNLSKYQSPPREENLKNKIVSLGSQIMLTGMQNYSNVQSLTPGGIEGYDSSSYQKFPQANIQINNISLIKKDSFNEDYKFIGSLNIRDELMSREDPIHSIRLANNKLQGFQEPSSDEDHSGEMIIQNDQYAPKDLERIHTPNLQSHDLNFSEYANLRQKFGAGDDDKQIYHENNQTLHEEIASLKKAIAHYQDQINKMEQQFQKERIESEDHQQAIKDQKCLLEKEKGTLQLSIEQYRIRISESEQSKKSTERNMQILLQNYEKVKEQLQKQQKSTNVQLQRLRNIIDEKISEVKEAKAEDNHNKQNHQNQMNQIKQLVLVKNQLMEELEQQLQEKNDKIDHLQSSLEQMRKKVALMRNDQQIDAASIYEQQFLRVKQTFLEQKRQLQAIIYELRQENEKLKLQLTTQINKSQQLYQTIQELSIEIQNLRHENSQLHHLKSQIENNYIENVKQLNIELEGMKGQIKGKDQTCYQSVNSNKTTQFDVNSPKVKIQYLTPHSSQLIGQEQKYMEDYCKKLESLLLKYQGKIIMNHNTIEELEEKVCEYLKDALQKEQEAENLYLKLVDFQNTINNLLVEKVTTELQNRRLTKSIQQCEKRLKTLGNRLIERVRERADYQSDEDDYLYE